MTEPHFPDLLLWAIPVFLSLIGAEFLWLRKHPIIVAFHEFAGTAIDVTQSGIRLGQRVKYIFAAPGYCHDGSRKTGNQIKADYVDAHPQQAGTPGLPSLETPNSEKQPLS